ncbi:FeoA family protein [Desulfonatronospira sp.]|uniref:FeoA family protein n=1 Tax=Desulfonatronospira sp. TaxID=1962951 RepID=UPI0025C20DCF|nr:FeoA family protein [Desulfonatronospira sp.]
MSISLAQAMFDEPLVLVDVACTELADRLARMGLYPGSELIRLQEEVFLQPVRVRGPGGDVVLPGGMASKVIVHHDDGHKTPVLEMLPGETGHIEGLVGGSFLSQSLEVLGIQEHDQIQMVRRVPPMDYLVRTAQSRVQLTESMAAKIWGEMNDREMQLVMAGKNKTFQVKKILGGPRAHERLQEAGIIPECSIALESVMPAASTGIKDRDRIVLRADSGLRIFLRLDQAGDIRVYPLHKTSMNQDGGQSVRR